MNCIQNCLSNLAIGKSATVLKITCTGDLQRRMMDLGIVPGTTIRALHKSPSGDPTAYSVLGSVIAIRDCDASKIYIKVGLSENEPFKHKK